MAKLSIKELTSRIMSVMILAGGLDRLTTVLTMSYDDFTDGVDLNFRTWIQGLVKGVQSEREERKNTKWDVGKKPNLFVFIFYWKKN